MDDEIITKISDAPPITPKGQDIIDATQNVIIDAAENVSEAIGTAGKNAITELPQEPFYTETHFWIGVAFVLVVLCLLKPICKFVHELLLRRVNKVVKDIDDASKLRDDAQVLLADYERKYLNAPQEIQILVENSRKNMQNVKKREISKLKTELYTKEKEADRRIAAATEKIRSEINSSASQASVNLAYKAIVRYLRTTDKSRLIDEAIADLDSFIPKTK